MKMIWMVSLEVATVEDDFSEILTNTEYLVTTLETEILDSNETQTLESVTNLLQELLQTTTTPVTAVNL